MGEFVNAMGDFLDALTFSSPYFHFLELDAVRGLFLVRIPVKPCNAPMMSLTSRCSP